MWGIVAQLGLIAASWAINKWIAPNPQVQKAKAKALREFQLPRTEEGMPLPIFWGKVRIKSPILAWYGRYRAEPTPGMPDGFFSYFLDMLFVVGVPGGGQLGDALNVKLLGIYYGDKIITLPFGVMTDDGEAAGVTETLGGYGSGGFLRGTVEFWRGSRTQDLAGSAIMASIVEEATIQDSGIETLVPGWRGMTVVGLSNFEIGESTDLQGISFLVSSRTATTLLGTPIVDLINGDANPVAVIVDILTNDWGRAGLPIERIDAASFIAASQVLDEENHGYSRVIYDPSTCEDVLADVLAQIDGILFQDPTTGTIKLRLVRSDYDVDDLPVYTLDDVAEIKAWNWSTWAETINKVRVVYTDYGDGEKTKTKTSPSNFSVQGGKSREATFQYPGITTATLAQQVADRELAELAVPQLMAELLMLDGPASRLLPGDVFRFVADDPDYLQVDVVMRVLSADRAVPGDRRPTVRAMRDKYAPGAYNFAGGSNPLPTGSSASSAEPYPIPFALVTEAPRFLLEAAVAAGRITSAESQRLMVAAARPTNGTRYQATSVAYPYSVQALDVPLVSYGGFGVLNSIIAREDAPLWGGDVEFHRGGRDQR